MYVFAVQQRAVITFIVEVKNDITCPRYFSFSHKELGVTQSLHGYVYKVVIYEGQVTLCNYFCAVQQVADRKSVYTGLAKEI